MTPHALGGLLSNGLGWGFILIKNCMEAGLDSRNAEGSLIKTCIGRDEKRDSSPTRSEGLRLWETG
jgi:hypothetical protein